MSLFSITEEAILRDTDRIEGAIRVGNSAEIAGGASSIARRADRVLQVAEMEAQNSEDPKFVDNVNRAAERLSHSE